MPRKPDPEKTVKILLAGSSHTRLFYPFVKNSLKGAAHVSKLPYDAGRTDEILQSIAEWPLEGQDIIHFYAGHRDLILNEEEQPYIKPGPFEKNLRKITGILLAGTSAIIVFSDIPPVSERLLTIDADWNKRILRYNRIIEKVAGDAHIPVHSFRKFILACEGVEDEYVDDLHFTRRVYREFGEELAAFLIKLPSPAKP